ncbi:MAG: dephospho-CoA kinase [Lachnospiraceae bacterium]|nr:dephospho-CoA kinase [Lachnospiraceae bacterium]
MITIGITGGVGSGKSVILKYLEEKYNACIIVADELAKELEEPGKPVYKKLVECFGDAILSPDMSIDKKAFASLIFSDEEALSKANAIIHPAVKEEILRRMKEEETSGCEVFVVEAALLIEDGYDKILDELWYVYTDEAVRFKRLEVNRGYDREKSLSIMRRQKSDIEFRKYCKRIIDNSGELEETIDQTDAIMHSIKALNA